MQFGVEDVGVFTLLIYTDKLSLWNSEENREVARWTKD